MQGSREHPPLPRHAKRRLAAKLSIGFIFCAMFLWLAFKETSVGDILTALSELRLLPILGSLICQFASHVLRSLRWVMLLSTAHASLSRHRAFAALMVGYAVNAILPRGGEVARAIHLRRIAHTSLAAGLSSVLLERLLDVAMLALLFPLVLLLYQNRLERLFPGIGTSVLIAGLVAATVLGAAYALSIRIEKNVAWVQSLSVRFWPSWEHRVTRMSRNFLQGFAGLFVREHRGAIAGLSGAIWLLYAASTWVLFYSLPPMATLGFSILDAAAVTLVAAAALCIPSPGGAGTVHFFVSQMLTNIFSVPLGPALAFATLLHAMSVLPTLAAGAMYAFFSVKSVDSQTVVSRLQEMDTQNGKDSI